MYLCYLYMHFRVRVHVVKQLLVVHVLLIPLQRLVIAEVVTQWNEKYLAAVQFRLFTVLIKEQIRPEDRDKKDYSFCCISTTFCS